MKLGEVSSPSGTLLILDAGFLGLWCHDRPPIIPAGTLGDAELEHKANDSVDLRIEGADAEAAGRTFHRQWHPGYLYDLPRDALPSLEASFRRHVLSHQWKAHLVILPERVTHLHRVELALAHGKGAGYVQLSGLGCVAIGGVPSDRTFDVEPGVAIACRDLPAKKSEVIGEVMVDRARLIVADVDALGSWVHEASLDGKADLAFWGASAETLAQKENAPLLPEGVHGWSDLAVEEAQARAERLQSLDENLTVDFRPHSHHFDLMAQVRATKTESGTLTVGGAKFCGFSTRSGMFPVVRELGPAGELVRIRIQLTDDQSLN